MQFWQLYQIFFCQKPKRFSVSVQKLERFCFSRILSLRLFHWIRRMPYWRTWVFLQIRFSSQKPSKDIKLYVRPNKVLPNILLVKWILFLILFWKASATNPYFLHSKSEKNVKLTFFLKKKHFCLKAFLWTYGMRCWQLRLKCLGRKPAIFHSLPISQKDLVSAKFFPRNAPLPWTRRKTSGSSSFSLKFLRTRRLQTRHRWRILFLRTWKFFAKIQEKY